MDTFHAVCVILFVTSYVTSSDIVLTSSPSTIRPLLTDVLTLRCSLKDGAPSVVIGKRKRDVTSDSAPSDVSFVHSVTITKEGVELATVSEHLSARVYDNTTGVQVAGQVPGSGDEKGFLQVSWKYPGSGQTGSYQCDIAGSDQNGHTHTFSKTMDVSETEVLLGDVVGYIHQLKLTDDDLKTTNTDLKAEIIDLKRKLNTHVIFTAILDHFITAPVNGTIVFNQLKTIIGRGYNVSTGVFTCPIAGYYMFDAHIMAQSNKLAVVKLVHNDHVVTTALAAQSSTYESASNSASLLLNHGDTVKVTAAWGQSYPFGDVYGYSSFSGHLLALV